MLETLGREPPNEGERFVLCFVCDLHNDDNIDKENIMFQIPFLKY